MKKLSKRQTEILSIIKKWIKEKGYSPTVRELMDATGLYSTSTIHHHLSRLSELGLLTWIPKANRTIRLIDKVG